MKLLIECGAIGFLAVVSMTCLHFLQIAPLFSFLKGNSILMQNFVFVFSVICVYGLSRFYWYMAIKGSNKVIAKLNNNQNDISKDKEDVEEVNSSGMKTFLMMNCIIAGPIMVYYLVPGTKVYLDAAVQRLLGELPAMIWKSGIKDRQRVWLRVERWAKLCGMLFVLLFVIEKILSILIRLLRWALRTILWQKKDDDVPQKELCDVSSTTEIIDDNENDNENDDVDDSNDDNRVDSDDEVLS